VGTSEKELFDQYKHQVKRLYSAVIEGSKEQLPVITAIEEDRSGVREIQEQFQLSSNLQQLKLEKDKARKTFDESGPHQGQIAQPTEELFKIDKLLDAAVEQLSIGPPVNVGIAGAHASDQDTSKRAIDDLVGSLFNVKFAGKPIKSRAGEASGGLWRHHGRLAASKLFRDVFSLIDTYRGKGPAYYATAVRNEQKRLARDFEIGDRDILGLTPKESKDLSKEGRELIRAANQTDADIDDLTTAAALSNSSPEEIVLAQEEERRMEAELDHRSHQLPPGQLALFESWRAGESPTDARERLGLPKSTETALRNRLKRWAREWRAQQAS
jgi:hypothetical protein